MFRRSHIPLTNTTTISQLLKAVRKGHIQITEPNRLAVIRHRERRRDMAIAANLAWQESAPK